MNEQYKNKIAPKYTDYKVKRDCTLLDFLINDIPGTSRTKAKKMLSLKMVFVDKQITTKFDTPLKTGQIVQISQKGNPYELRNRFVELVYEDAFIIVVNKAPGIVSVPLPGSRENSVKSILDEYVKRRNKRFSVNTIHRLDRATSGLMIFAKRRDIQQTVIQHWHEAVTDRRYVAVVEGIMDKKQGTVTSWLSDDKKYVIFSSPVDNGGKYAVTHYFTRKSTETCSLVELRLETGRTNQIRVHMKEIGHPVIGDEKYGNLSTLSNRLCLHAFKLYFIHPVTSELMKFETDIPKEFAKLVN